MVKGVLLCKFNFDKSKAKKHTYNNENEQLINLFCQKYLYSYARKARIFNTK